MGLPIYSTAHIINFQKLRGHP